MSHARSAYVRSIAMALALFGVGCSGAFAAPPPPPAEPVAVRVFGAPDAPLSGATITAGQGQPAMTDASGLATIMLDGSDGTKFEVKVTCPVGYVSPNRPLAVTLRRGSKTPEFAAMCKRVDRTVLVTVRTPGAVGLPIMYLGREISRTDDQGIALVSVDARVGDTFTLTIDTNDKKFQYYKPQSPEVSFSVTQDDDLFTYEQKFANDVPKVFRAAAPKPYVPHAI